MTRSLVGLLLNAAGVAMLWFGGVPYSTTEKLVDLGPIKATRQVDHKIDVPPFIGAGLVAVGSAELLLGRRR